VNGGSPNVFIEGLPAARLGDPATCCGPVDAVSKGSATVFINGKPASRRTDSCGHGGMIVASAAKTYIGDGPGSQAPGSKCHVDAAAEGKGTIS
jgi:uncharacterized Zn-binding protein involved in type VI secretion